MTPLTEQEIEHFKRLYHDGAWTWAELRKAFAKERINALREANYLVTVPTEMGRMTLLVAAGRRAAYRIADRSCSLARQLDWAYVRLSAQARGWRVPNERDSRGLEEYDRSGLFAEMHTEFGRALVTGRLGGGGYSAQSLQRIVDRLRSSALFHDFRVVILTPHPRRGQGIARSNAAFFKVVHALPQVSPPDQIGRVQPTPTWGDEPPHPGPVITAYGAAGWSAQGVPDLTLSILQMTRKERVERAEEALALDGVMTAGQLARHFWLDPHDLQGRYLVPALVRPIHGRQGLEVSARFLLAARAVGKLNDDALAHRAGTAELRHLLGISPERRHWQVNPRNSKGLEEPDAIYASPRGTVAVEFDRGFYPWTKIRSKLQTWEDLGYVDVIWGVSGTGRQRNLTAKMNRPVYLAPWWNALE